MRDCGTGLSHSTNHKKTPHTTKKNCTIRNAAELLKNKDQGFSCFAGVIFLKETCINQKIF